MGEDRNGPGWKGEDGKGEGGKGEDGPEQGPPKQLALDLPVEPSFGRDEFLPAPANEAALAMIMQWPDWPDRILSLLGPPGSGKSHLAAIWARGAGAMALAPRELPSLQRLVAARPAALLIDDVDRVEDETALFHLLNFSRENDAFLLLTARRPPRGDTVRLPDLLSRLRRAPVVEIGPPDDGLMRAVLEKLFRDRQLSVEAGLIDYIALRLERSLGAARAFVRDIDREALARGRRVTRALAAELLERLRQD
jgi:chromosomal replication initiation ATPase DnaA